MPGSEVFGSMISGAQVEDAVVATLQKWLSTYIAEVSAQNGYGRNDLPRIASYQVLPDFDKWPENAFPAIVVVSGGITERPKKVGGGRIQATWGFGMGVFCSANTQENTNKMAKIYTAAIRTCLLQHASLLGFAIGLDWEDETYNDLGTDDSRSIAAGRGLFTVTVDNVALAQGGPRNPVSDASDEPLYDPTTPYSPVTVLEVDTQIEREDV